MPGKIIGLLLLAAAAAWARPPVYPVAVISDRDGFTNGRSGPATTFPVKRRLAQDEHFIVTRWPWNLRELKSAGGTALLRKAGLALPQILEWRWVYTLERDPKDPPSASGGWVYVHQSRVKVVRQDAVGWGWITDPEGFTNVRAAARGDAPVVARVGLAECFIILDQPAYAKLQHLSNPDLQSVPWTKVLTRDGLAGYMKSDRLQAHDGRDWQWAGPIPYVL